jgi:2'-5' RNA ligase
MNKRNGDELRVFVACELPEDVKRGLGRVQDDLRRDGVDDALRWVQPDIVHLTMKFLGPVPRSELGRLKEALEGAIEPFSFSVRPVKVGTFGGARMRVVWAGLEGDVEGLAALAGRIDEALAPLGFERERRPFAAHLTLARVRDRATEEERRSAALVIRRYRMPSLPSMTLSEVALMESRLGPGGSTYHRLGRFPEAGEGERLDGLGG